MANFYKDNSDIKFQLSHPLMGKIVELKEQNFKDFGKYDYAPSSVEDAIDSYDKVMEIMGEICGDVLAPNAEQVDHDGPVCKDGRVTYAAGTQQNQDVLTQAGLYGMSLPREYGGLNFSMVPYVMAAELTGRADAGFSNIWGLQDCAETIGTNSFRAYARGKPALWTLPNQMPVQTFRPPCLRPHTMKRAECGFSTA